MLDECGEFTAEGGTAVDVRCCAAQFCDVYELWGRDEVRSGEPYLTIRCSRIRLSIIGSHIPEVARTSSMKMMVGASADARPSIWCFGTLGSAMVIASSRVHWE